MTSPPSHVVAAFGLSGRPLAPLDDEGPGYWRSGEIVLKPAGEPVVAAWVAATLDRLRPEGVQIARPVRSSDGRWVVGGWVAQRYQPGAPEPRMWDTLQASEALDRALSRIPRPGFLDDRRTLTARADRLAWEPSRRDMEKLGGGTGGELFVDLLSGCRPLRLPSQVVHVDLFGTVLFQPWTNQAAVLSRDPLWRPANWSAAVVVVDAMAWGGAGIELFDHGLEIDQWPQLLRRALMFRLAFTLLHPRSTPEALNSVLTAARALMPELR